MPKVSIKLTGANKENVTYVLLGNKRWGLNGEAYATQQTVASGEQVWKVDFPKSEASNTINVPDAAQAVMTVDAEPEQVTVSF